VSVDSLDAVRSIIPVSRETGERLAAYVALVRKWQPAENLIAPAPLPEIWQRHVADSAQLLAIFPGSQQWLDLGTGAGFPGLVVAIAGEPGTHVHLVESNRRKCAFLRTAVRETGAPATVHEGRVADILAAFVPRVDRVAARALAPLSELLGLAEPVMTAGTPAAFHKGQDYRAEIADAYKSWAFDLVEHPSRVGEGGMILEISNLRRKPR